MKLTLVRVVNIPLICRFFVVGFEFIAQLCKSNESAYKRILKICGAVMLATDSNLAGTAGVVGGLLALETEHFVRNLIIDVGI